MLIICLQISSVYRRRKDILHVGEISGWSVNEHESGILHRPILDLPNNVSLPSSIEYSVVPAGTSNGDMSTSSQSPPWSQPPQDERLGKSSTSSSSSYVRSVQSCGPSNEEHPPSPYPSYNDQSPEYKPFDLCQVQENSQDVVSMMAMVREVVRQELALEDEDTHFAKSIAHMLRRMDRTKRNKTKVRLLQLLSEIDEEKPD